MGRLKSAEVPGLPALFESAIAEFEAQKYRHLPRGP